MKVRNRRNGTNTIAYKVGGIAKSEIITSGSVVNLTDLTDFNQVINKQDFNRGWFVSKIDFCSNHSTSSSD